MNLRDKLNYVRNFFKGKDSKIDPMFYLPVKTIIWSATQPDCYFDHDDECKTYTAEEMVELEKRYFLVHLNIVNTQEEIAISDEADKKLEAIRENSSTSIPQ